MTSHVLPPISGGGGGGRESVLVTGSPFADLSALETWSQANPSELLNNETQVATAQVGTSPNFITYEWIGANGVYSANSWSNSTGLTGPQTAAVNSIINLSDDDLPRASSGTLIDSNMSQESDGTLTTPGDLRIATNTLRFASAQSLSTAGRNSVFRDEQAGEDRFPIWQSPALGRDASTVRHRYQEVDLPLGADETDLTNPTWTITVPQVGSEDGQTARYTDVTVVATSVLTNVFVEVQIGGVEFEVFGPLTLTTGSYRFNYDPNFDYNVGDVLTFRVFSDDGDVILRGQTATSIPALTNRIALWVDETIAIASDIDHPVTLRRDMPTEVDAQALVDASLNDNSALWVVANNQLTSSNRADATLVAQIAGFLDLDGNEIPTTPVAANTIQLRTGTIVRIFAANDYRVVNSPVFEGDIPAPLPPVDISAQEFTITTANYTNYLDRTIRLTNSNTGVIQVIRFDSIASFLALSPGRDVTFSFIVNRGASNLLADWLPAGGNTIGGSSSQRRQEDQVINITLPAAGTDWLVTSVNALPASNVTVDRTDLSTVQGNDAQAAIEELERLFGIVTQLRQEVDAEERPLNLFDSAVTVTAANLGDFINRNNIYSATRDQRVNFVPPPESALTGQYPVAFELSHFGGTRRFDTGFTPTNTVVITRPSDYSASDPSTFLRRGSETGANLQFAELHQGDTGLLTKQDADSPWVIQESSADPRSSILPAGVFQINSRGVTLPVNVNGDHFVGGLTLYTPNQGDAFVVTGSGISEESTFGRAIFTGDVIVAKQDSPSLLLDENNDDWLIIRDAQHSEITLTELRFLAQITEADTFTFGRLETRSDVTAARVWLASDTLDHAPFITPSTDTDNPQASNGATYVGGDENVGSDNDFEFNQNRHANEVYLDIDGSFDVSENINDIFVQVKNSNGDVVNTFSLANQFRAITLTGSTDTYYVLNTFSQVDDNFSTINYVAGQTIEVLLRETNRSFNLDDSINVLSAVQDGTIDIAKLSTTVQSLLNSDHTITTAQEQKLAGLELTAQTEVLGIGFTFYAILGSSVSSSLADYHEIQQGNGILPDYERTISYVLLVDPAVQFTQLQKVESTTTKQDVTVVGAVTVDDAGAQRQFIAYRVTLPAITGANSVLDNAWQIDGMLDTSVLSGANSTFKVDRSNMADTFIAWIQSQIPDTPTPTTLPEALQQLLRHLTITTDTSSTWTKIDPSPIRAELTRQFAALWDENRRSFTGNYFADLTNVEVAGFTSNTIFYYNDPSDRLNTSFPGAQSYILDDNVRIRNINSGTNISTSRNKIISFNYALQRELESGDNASILRVGNTSTTPMIGLSEQEGLYLNIGRGDGAQQSRTYESQFQVDNNQWHVPVGQTVNDEAEIIIPDDLTGSLTFKVRIHLDNNGNDEGNHEETFTITNVGADQNLGQRTFSYTDVDGHSGTLNLTLNFNYDHDNTDLSRTRRVVLITTVTALQNAAFTYGFEAFREVTETWNHPTTYARFPINAGSGHDDFGLFDPHRYTTEGVHQRNRVILAVTTARDGDTSSDPELALRVVVDGETEVDTQTSDNLIPLGRPASDFTFNDMSFGNSLCAISHIQCYDYTGETPSSSELQALYTGQADWLHAFWPPGRAVDRMTIDANLELSSGHAFILTDTGDATRKTIEIDNGSILIKNAQVTHG